MPLALGASTGWTVGLILGIVVVVVVAAIVIAIVTLALRIARQAAGAVEGVGLVRAQTEQLGSATELRGVPRINDSGVRILHSARALRKVAVGK
jgi:nitrate/nitrite-specific signal transduction histidine kinase